MAATRADLIVVGARPRGLGRRLGGGRAGMDVVVLEAFQPGHRNGSSHGSARIFRRAYPDPLYVRLTGQAGHLWRLLEAEASESLLRQTGGLDFGARRNPEQLYGVLTELRVPAELLAPAAAAERWPYVDFTSAGQVMYHGKDRRARPRARDGRDAPAGRTRAAPSSGSGRR